MTDGEGEGGREIERRRRYEREKERDYRGGNYDSTVIISRCLI